MPKEINWILFDLSGVISNFVLQSEEEHDINGKTVIPKQLEAIYGMEGYCDYMTGRISHEEFVNAFLEEKSFPLSVDEFADVYKQSIIAIDGIEDILKKLHRKYNLAILTNEGIEWANYKLDGTGLGDYFDHMVISAEIQTAKPDRQFYEKALQQLGAIPEECIFIDDFEENVQAAEEYGIKSVLFSNPDQLEKELFTRLMSGNIMFNHAVC